jgi:hypothetical protein
MNRRCIVALSAVALCVGTAITSGAMAQQKSLKDQLVGTWMLVSNVVTCSDKSTYQPFGPNPSGSLVLDASGRATLVIIRPGLPKIAANNREAETADEGKTIAAGSLAWVGSYTVNEADRTLNLHIDHSSYPNWDGENQKRLITSLSADELKYTNPVSSVGAVASDLVWKRAK